MQLPAIYRERPIAAWTFTIGLLLVLAWAFFGRAFGGGGGSAASDGVAFQTGMPDPNAQLAAGAQMAAAQLASQDMRYQTDAATTLALAELSVAKSLGEMGFNLDDRVSYRQLEAHQISEENATARYIVGQQAASDQLSMSLAAQTEQYNVLAALEAVRDANQTAQTIALINSQSDQAAIWGQVQMGMQQAATQQAQIAASAQKKLSSNSLLGGLLGGVLTLFSDERLKTDVQFVGMDARGFPLHSWRYTEQAVRMDKRLSRDARYIGVMAQDLLNTPYAHAVGIKNGWFTVDYSRFM